MSWYSLYKLSMPVIDRPKDMNYMDIGHENMRLDKNDYTEEMWFIGKDLKLQTEFANKDFTHCGIFGYNYVAKGRYAVNAKYPNGVCSISWGSIPFESKRRRVIKILEDNYGSNVKIIEFSNWS